jgi:S1-C subfamily serine protease
MRRSVLYSRSRPGPGQPPDADAPPAPASPDEPRPPARHAPRLLAALRHPGAPWAAVLALGAALALSHGPWRAGTPRQLTQDDINAAVLHTMQHKVLPSQATRAAAAVAPSLVRVEGVVEGRKDRKGQAEPGRGVGSGVVIVDNGTILTNLHVVWGAKKIRVRFANGHESEAVMVGAQPENDLAVLKALSLPDDLEAATMRSTADLRPGDHVIAVGHPFGIGPSVSYGVVSGLKRAFRAPDGEKTLSNLIQFDAAANPGNSGGPLVTMDGQVVGIVTAILNPGEARTFIGIGFAVPIENAASAAGMPPF